jgi:hypothetical protein
VKGGGAFPAVVARAMARVAMRVDGRMKCDGWMHPEGKVIAEGLGGR